MLREAALAEPRPLRVLMVLESNFSKRGGGGAESQLRTVAQALRKMGHRVAIVTPMLPGGPQTPVDKSARVPVARMRYPKVKLVGALLLQIKFAAFLWRNRARWDAWHVHIAHNLGAITCWVGSLVGKPVVVKVSGWWELEKGVLGRGAGLRGALARRWLRRATVIQAISTRIAAELERHGFDRSRILVLPNAVDTARFAVRAKPRAAGQPLVAVYVGRLVKEKDLHVLLDAWAHAFGGRSDVRLQLVGGGPAEAELRDQAARLGIQPEFLGHRDDIEDLLAHAHVGLLTSRIEGLSNTLLEFMASGLPAIASAVSGSEDFVKTGRNGWLFPVGDVAALADCLRQAAALPPAELAAMGRHARTDVETAASIPLVVGRLVELYRGAA